MKSKLALFAIAVGTSVIPTPASADALYPFLLSYRQCAHATLKTPGVPSEASSIEREHIIDEAAPFIAKYYPFNQLAAKRNLEVSLTYEEQHADWAATCGELHQPIELRYISCLTENAFSDEMYRAGKFLNGRAIERKCSSLYQDAKASFQNDRDGKKAKVRLWRIKSTFMNLRDTPFSGEDSRALLGP